MSDRPGADGRTVRPPLNDLYLAGVAALRHVGRGAALTKNIVLVDVGFIQKTLLPYEGSMVIPDGVGLSGVTWKGEPPFKMGYEISLEARRVSGGHRRH